MPKEELKFASTASDLPLLKQALLKTADDGRTTQTTLTSTYYDTAAASLKRAGLALRVQEQNRRYIQTVIAANVTGVPPLSCGECEDVIDSERPDPRALNCSALCRKHSARPSYSCSSLAYSGVPYSCSNPTGR